MYGIFTSRRKTKAVNQQAKSQFICYENKNHASISVKRIISQAVFQYLGQTLLYRLNASLLHPPNYQVLNQIDGDILFLVRYGFKNPTESKIAVHQLRAEPLWSKLNVVKQGKVYVVDEFYWLTGSYLSANRVLDDLFRYLVKR